MNGWTVLWQADDLNALNVSEIEIVVWQGEVWLSEKFMDTDQSRLAEDLVNGINSVRCVHNKLTVEPD